MSDSELAIKVFGGTFLCAFILMVCMLGCDACQHDKLEKAPKYRIDYIDNSGNIRYSRYTSFVRHTYNGISYEDFTSKNPVSTNETVEIIEIR